MKFGEGNFRNKHSPVDQRGYWAAHSALDREASANDTPLACDEWLANGESGWSNFSYGAGASLPAGRRCATLRRRSHCRGLAPVHHPLAASEHRRPPHRRRVLRARDSRRRCWLPSGERDVPTCTYSTGYRPNHQRLLAATDSEPVQQAIWLVQ